MYRIVLLGLAVVVVLIDLCLFVEYRKCKKLKRAAAQRRKDEQDG